MVHRLGSVGAVVHQASVTCYPIPGKSKALLLCEAFAAGVIAAGGQARVCAEIPTRLEPGAAVFYGVRPVVAHLWEQAKAEKREWIYIDNAYHDVAREKFFRITRDAIQHTGIGESDGKRFAALGIQIKPMREGGDHIIVACQSDEFMAVVAGDPGWLKRITRSLAERKMHIIVRRKGDPVPLKHHLEKAALLVTYSSAAAVTALLEGVRVTCAPECCATYAGEDRRRWAGVLSDNQWDISEIRRGDAWRALNA